MPIWQDNDWLPVSVGSDWWRVLGEMGLDRSFAQGWWRVRGSGAQTPPSVDWSSVDQSHLRSIQETVAGAQAAVRLNLGDAELEFQPNPQMLKPAGWRSRLNRWWTVAVGILVKLKLVLVFGSVLVSLVLYGLAFGWVFGAGLIVLIIIHESGHMVANRIKGIPFSLPIFVPFLGAFIQIKRFPKSAADEAFIGVMGPLFGLAASLISLGLGLALHQVIFLIIAEMGFLLHVFNLMPVLPLDGGRTVGFWRWRAWIPGMAGVLLVLFYNPLSNKITIDPLTLIIVAIIVISLRREPRMHSTEYTAIPIRTRWFYTILWGVALAVSMAGYWGVGQFHPL
jgi:Zn-dependent protease